MVKHRNVEIVCEPIGRVAVGATSIPVVRCRATVKKKTFKGTMDEVKEKIDAELGQVKKRASSVAKKPRGKK